VTIPGLPAEGPAPLDVLIVGSGVAGLSAAVRAAGSSGLRVGVATKAELAQSTTRWAQGGVAAVLGVDEDSTDLHLADTLAAGAGLCDVDAVKVLVGEGPARVEELIAMGAVFDRHPGGGLALAREGGHSTARVVHAGGAATGAEIERALVEAVRETAAALLEGWFAVDLVVEGGRCQGVVALDPSGRPHEVRASHVVLAAGGAGQLYAVTTNPSASSGDGVAMALRRGVAVADIEFMQFHPTALHHPAMPRPLLSEALRGHGARLRDADGRRFVEELSPRDVVSRAMATRMLEQGVDHLWLDATALERFDQRFPTIAASVRSIGLDPGSDWLPIAPAAHYLSGGLLTDLDGASTLPGLWACGEVACTGVHGANRLASNSLLEGMVFAARVVEAIADDRDGPEPTGAMGPTLEALGCTPANPAATSSGNGDTIPVRLLDRSVSGQSGPASRAGHLSGPASRAGHLSGPASRAGLDDPGQEAAVGDDGEVDKRRHRLQQAMTIGAGVIRSEASLATAHAVVEEVAGPGRGPATWELANLVEMARAVLAAASARRESRGAHSRSDFPGQDPALRCRLVPR
jgi:L-aspartate oxidase